MHSVRGDVSLNGNIGAGKSTLIKLICEKDPNYIFYDEPVHEWEFLLGEIYKNGRKDLIWFFQWRVVLYYTKITEDVLRMGPNRTQPIVVTRSPYSAYLFMRANKDAIDREVQKGLVVYLNELIKMPFWNEMIDVYIYQDAEACFKNMTDRKGVEKGSVSLAYLDLLEKIHEKAMFTGHWDRKINAYDLQLARDEILDFVKKENVEEDK